MRPSTPREARLWWRDRDPLQWLSWLLRDKRADPGVQGPQWRWWLVEPSWRVRDSHKECPRCGGPARLLYNHDAIFCLWCRQETTGIELIRDYGQRRFATQ